MVLSTLIPILVVVLILFTGFVVVMMFWKYQQEQVIRERQLREDQERFEELYRKAQTMEADILMVLSEGGEPMNPGRRRVQVNLKLPEGMEPRETQVIWEVDDFFAKEFKVGDRVQVRVFEQWVWPLIEGAKLFIP